MEDKTLRGGLIFLGIGFAVIIAVWFFALRDTQVASEPIRAMPLPPAQVPAAATVYEIVPAASTARFELGETLRGNPATVVGVTRQVSGQLAVDLDQLHTAVIGPILINARALVTDNEFRDAAIRNRILRAEQYEFIRFTPQQIDGLPPEAAPGEPLTFRVSGVLTVTGRAQPVTFAVTAVAPTPQRIEGEATTTINRNDFDLTIPEAPNVADVSEQVEISLNFVAEALPAN
jgi:polyisoprenoid-binding protein YceI